MTSDTFLMLSAYYRLAGQPALHSMVAQLFRELIISDAREAVAHAAAGQGQGGHGRGQGHGGPEQQQPDNPPPSPDSASDFLVDHEDF